MKWEVGGPNSNHAALILNGQESEIQSSNFVKSEVNLKSLKSEVGRPSSTFVRYGCVQIFFQRFLLLCHAMVGNKVKYGMQPS